MKRIDICYAVFHEHASDDRNVNKSISAQFELSTLRSTGPEERGEHHVLLHGNRSTFNPPYLIPSQPVVGHVANSLARGGHRARAVNTIRLM